MGSSVLELSPKLLGSGTGPLNTTFKISPNDI